MRTSGVGCVGCFRSDLQDAYFRSARRNTLNNWHVVMVTASSERQAGLYRDENERRRLRGMLPIGSTSRLFPLSSEKHIEQLARCDGDSFLGAAGGAVSR